MWMWTEKSRMRRKSKDTVKELEGRPSLLTVTPRAGGRALGSRKKNMHYFRFNLKSDDSNHGEAWQISLKE